jgi:hypothetical protein
MNQVFKNQVGKHGNVFRKNGLTTGVSSFIDPDDTVEEVVEKVQEEGGKSRLDPPEVEGGSIETVQNIIRKLNKRMK